MKIERIDFNSQEFKKVIKDAPKKIVLFNEKAKYYCTRIDNEIVSICGIANDRDGYKMVTSFTYEKYRGRHIMYEMVKHIISKHKSNVYYVNANENSSGVYERIGFKKLYRKKFKYFTRITMILRNY